MQITILTLTPAEVDQLPDLRAKGTYLLHFWLEHPLETITIGRFGIFALMPGHYYYIGSAFGTGGLAARLRRHMTIHKRCHWHIDYLRPYLELQTIWVSPTNERLECVWCTLLATLPELSRPIAHFGASDTGCGGHLFYAVDAVPEARMRHVLLTTNIT
jgi:Uri superfamily endonuclease